MVSIHDAFRFALVFLTLLAYSLSEHLLVFIEAVAFRFAILRDVMMRPGMGFVRVELCPLGRVNFSFFLQQEPRCCPRVAVLRCCCFDTSRSDAFLKVISRLGELEGFAYMGYDTRVCKCKKRVCIRLPLGPFRRCTNRVEA